MLDKGTQNWAATPFQLHVLLSQLCLAGCIDRLASNHGNQPGGPVRKVVHVPTSARLLETCIQEDFLVAVVAAVEVAVAVRV